MQHTRKSDTTRSARQAWRSVQVLFGALSLCVSALAAPVDQDRPCAERSLSIESEHIWVDAQGEGDITVVFEAGFGNDSGVWSALTPRVRALGVRTLVYDRAGMGRSSLDASRPYSMERDMRTLRSVLDRCQAGPKTLFVGHSYGGAIGLLAATQDQRIRSLVLVDAVVPGVWTDAEVAKNLQSMRAQYDELRAKAPALAQVAIPFAEALPATARLINGLRIPGELPIIDIVAENGQREADTAQAWRLAHEAFTADQPRRRHVLAVGSSHKVMADQPDVVLRSIADAVGVLRRR